MKKPACLLLLILFSTVLLAQEMKPTEVLLVTGKVKKERSFTLAEIRSFRTMSLGDVNTSCSPRQKEEAKQVKGILVKDLLDSVRFQYEKPKHLNQFYFKFEGSDGYTVVYSFNEIYNTETGKNLFLVTEKDGQDISKMDNRILLLTISDIKSGTRNIKGLARIVVCMAQ